MDGAKAAGAAPIRTPRGVEAAFGEERGAVLKTALPGAALVEWAGMQDLIARSRAKRSGLAASLDLEQRRAPSSLVRLKLTQLTNSGSPNGAPNSSVRCLRTTG